jgi:hydroxymethylbilane synthase
MEFTRLVGASAEPRGSGRQPVTRLVIGTRGSRLALWQTEHVAELLQAAHRGLIIETVVIKSEGDIDLVTPLARSQTTGIFVRRLEQALQAKEIDLAVHSLKDMPTDQPDGLTIAGIPERHDARDALLSREGWTLDELPLGTVVGTGSPRRRGQLLHRRPDLKVVDVRGNLDTRLRKLTEGQFGALVLAVAGVDRLGIDSVPYRPLALDDCLPAAGQGALGVEVREDAKETREIIERLTHKATAACVEAERAFLRRLDAGCQASATAYARHEADKLRLDALVADVDGKTVLMERESGSPEDGIALGTRLADRLRVAGADAILAAARRASSEDDAAG